MNKIRKWFLKKIFRGIYKLDDIEIKTKEDGFIIECENFSLISKDNLPKILINGKEFNHATNLNISVDCDKVVILMDAVYFFGDFKKQFKIERGEIK